ncbi:MAG: hypothetical protein GY940_30935 [bacterium]|nr:hypothetical protein [bacterium]
MRTLTVSIEESEFSRLGFKDENISFSELEEKLSIEYAKRALAKCRQIAKKTGLSEMTMEEINAEIQAVRNNASNCN